MNYDDQRRFPRIPAECAVLVTPVGPENQEALAKTRVLGSGGCMFVHGGSVGVDHHVQLLISVHGRVVKARSRVVYERPHASGGVEGGVEFTHLGEEDRKVIDALLGGPTGPPPFDPPQ